MHTLFLRLNLKIHGNSLKSKAVDSSRIALNKLLPKINF